MLDRIDVKYFKLAVGQQNIKTENDVDIAATCPVCGDSHRGDKARLHLYTKNNLTFVNCFNGGCPVENRIPYTFLRDFFPEHLNGYKRETFHLRMDNMKETFRSTENSFLSSDIITPVKNKASLSSDNIINAFASIKNKETQVTQITHIEAKDKIEIIRLNELFQEFKNSPAEDYLKSRGLKYNECNVSFGKFYYSPTNIRLDDDELFIKDSIIIPLYYKNEMYGFYSRSIKTKNFYSFVWKNTGYKIWNYFNIKPEPVYVFEGIFDAMSSGYDNILGSMGAKIPNERLNDLKEYCKDVIFVLDSDRTGLLNSLEYAKMGHTVYVPPKKYGTKDINNLITELNMNKEDIRDLIQNNLFRGIQAQIKIKQLL